MKKFIFILCAVFGIVWNADAQTYKFYSTDFAYRAQDDYGRWSDWSDWEETRCLVTISIDRDVINIYSDTPQEFDIYEYVGEEVDADGGESLEYKCVDANGLRCHIRLRAQSDGTLQLYVDYSDVSYVYCIVERN
ncbi:MAG: hypothetical protein IJ464_00785 [Alistipes sp.]|nr:hypothetical protein [Alistipes sp.]